MAGGGGDGGATEPVSAAARVLILAPHPDDEIVACGIAAVQARAAGAAVGVLYLTTGVPARETLWRWQWHSHAARVRRRRDEAAAAASLIGLDPLEFLDIPARGLKDRLAFAGAAIVRAVAAFAPAVVWVPAFEGAHQDHDAANLLAARCCGGAPVEEFAAYNYAGGHVSSNRFAEPRGGEAVLVLDAGEAALKRRALALYRSERGNLAHIRTMEEWHRPLPCHDYATPPHPGTLFRERFHWVPFRHPRVDFERSADVYGALGRAALDAVSVPGTNSRSG